MLHLSHSGAFRGGAPGSTGNRMTIYSTRIKQLPDQEQKQAALSYLSEAWAEARMDGVDGDCLAQASMFTAFAELITTYGEDAVAKFVEGLPARVRNGEFSVEIVQQ